MPVVSKTGDNPFLTSILLYNNHRNVNTIELKSTEIPVGFYNIRSPYNTFVIDGITYTVPPGNYTIDTLIDAMNFTCPCIFSRIGNRIVITQANPYLLRNFIASDATTTTVHLNWTAPFTVPASYAIRTVPSTNVINLSGSATSYVFNGSGLVGPGTEITFYLNPIFAGGGQGPEVASNPIFLVPPPGTVSSFVASNPQETTVDLAWNSAAYAILYSIVSSPATTTQTTSGTTYTFTGLSPSTEYTFTITPSNANNINGTPTTSGPITTLTPLPLPGAVINFVASNPQDYSIDLAWDPALDATLYYLVSSPPMTNFNTSDTFFSFTGLDPGTEYTFTITPSNATGNGPPTTSDPVSTLLPLPGPGPAPYNTFTDLTTTTIGVSWENGVTSYATSYNVYAYIVGTDVLVGFQNAPTSPYIYTGLLPNYAYYFTIKGVNATGEGEAGAPNAGSAFTVPEVTGFYTSNPQDTTIDLTWDAPDMSVVNQIQWEITTTPTTTTQTASAYGYFPIPYTFTGLTPDTEYTFTITPQVGPDLLAGDPVTSDPISTLLPFPGNAPAVYSTPVSVTTTTIELTWSTDPPYPPSYATSYNVYCHDPVTNDVLFVQSASLTPPYTFTGLQTNYGYSFNLSSVNARGEGTPSAVSDIMYTVPTVTGVAVSNPTETTVDITWDAITTNLSPGDFNRVITSTPETTTQYSSGVPPYTFTGLTPDTTYTFTVTPQVAYNYLTGDPVTSDPISTLLPLPSNGNDITVSNPTATSFVLSWDPSDYATSYELYEFYFSLGPISVSGTTYTWTGLTPDTYFSFYLIPVNATGSGLQSTPTTAEKTLIQVNLAYTGTIETLELRPGNYNFQMAGGSGPQKAPFYGGGRCFAEYTFLYTVTSTITIQYAIGQASPGDVGGAGGTYIYDMTNSQYLFVAGGAGTNDFSPNPADNAPGDGSGGVAGSGGGAGAGVNSNGSDSTVSAGYGGTSYENGAYGGAAGTFGDSPQQGGFGGGGGGTLVYDPDLPIQYGFYAYYPGGGGGYTGGTTFTAYDPGNYALWTSTPGTSYMISGATLVGSQGQQGSASVTNGYININIYLP
jgi:hypothetical protein